MQVPLLGSLGQNEIPKTKQVASMNHSEITIFTIGFAGKSAEQFFSILQENKMRKILDVRLYNRSQLAGFTKQKDLEFFLRAILGAEYEHLPEFAPTKQLLDDYKAKRISWEAYEDEYRKLLDRRRPDDRLTRDEMNDVCLLCSEPHAEHCHRRLAAEFLGDKWGNIRIVHL